MTTQDILTVTAALLPMFAPIAMGFTVIALGFHIFHIMARLIRDGFTETPSEERKHKSDTLTENFYYSDLEPLPKRKNNEPIRIGDDGELILPDGFDDRIED